MTLSMCIETIIEASEELNNEEIDYEKMDVLTALLNRLIERFRERSKECKAFELKVALFSLSTSAQIIKNERTMDILYRLYSMTLDRLYSDGDLNYYQTDVNSEKR